MIFCGKISVPKFCCPSSIQATHACHNEVSIRYFGATSLSAAPCSQNVTHCRKEICSTCLFKTSIPAVPFWNSKHPLPTRSRFLRATVRSTSSALWLHHAHPFVAATEKNLSHAEKQKVWSRSCGLQDLLRPIQ